MAVGQLKLANHVTWTFLTCHIAAEFQSLTDIIKDAATAHQVDPSNQWDQARGLAMSVMLYGGRSNVVLKLKCLGGALPKSNATHVEALRKDE